MPSLFALAAPLALVWPWTTGGEAPGRPAAPAASAPRCEARAAMVEEPQLPNPLSALRASQSARQVRIEQRVVIRVAPQPLAARRNLFAELPDPDAAPRPRFEERRREKCVPLQGIAGVQTGSGNRLVLFLRNQRMVSVNLEKSCRARDFYSGFYVEKNEDGRLCAARDQLQSRTGARCQIAAMRQLVAVDD
ncbi:hypothetical protein [Erythrobacter cryptus]|uniref:hypothetical protein n=1 Tax=Erythrobacter cryptus TaxID=196588 RepID=UPI00048A1FD1|nr:hypothetical protein [Erythrobacter cryptus]